MIPRLGSWKERGEALERNREALALLREDNRRLRQANDSLCDSIQTLLDSYRMLQARSRESDVRVEALLSEWPFVQGPCDPQEVLRPDPTLGAGG